MMPLFKSWRRRNDPLPVSAQEALQKSVEQRLLAEALSSFGGQAPNKSVAAAIAVWAVRTMGGESASEFADHLVKVVRIARMPRDQGGVL